jgi:mannose-6-phosphate isomerase
MKPAVLPPNVMRRMYRGGGLLAAFRGIERLAERAPEDWVGSTVPVRGEQELGQARLADDTPLVQLLQQDPIGLLGPVHVRQYGPDPRILVKLFDADERLPVHCHPSRAFARQFMGSEFGKTEASVVIATRQGKGKLFFGFRREVDEAALEALVADQDSDGLLALLNEVELEAGDCVYAPGGTPHALDAGALVLEIQEPTDLSILLEWKGFDIDVESTRRGRSLHELLRGVDRSAWSPGRIATVTHRSAATPSEKGSQVSLLPAAANHFFGLEEVDARSPVGLKPGFSIFIVTVGAGAMTWEADVDEELQLHAGEAIMIPFSAGASEIRGVKGLRCLPPSRDPELNLSSKEQ